MQNNCPPADNSLVLTEPGFELGSLWHTNPDRYTEVHYVP